MVRKVEIVVEKFNEGITVRWNDEEGGVRSVKTLAPEGSEAKAIGNILFNDIDDVFDASGSDTVKLKIEYIPS